MKHISRFTGFLALLAAPLAAWAEYGLVNTTVHDVGSVLPEFPATSTVITCDQAGGACGFVILAFTVINNFRPLLTIVAILVITLLGTRMIISQEDDRLEKTRAAMTGLISGTVLLYIIEPFIKAFYGKTGEVLRDTTNINQAVSDVIKPEINGIINWVLVIVASLAMLMIILNALKAVLKSGGDDGIAGIRKTLISVAAGLAILVLRTLITDRFVANPSSPVPVLGTVVTVVNFLFGFLALAAIAVVIYTGIALMLSFGKEDQWQQAKGTLGRALLGFVVILMCLTLVNFVIGPAVGT